MVTQTQKEILSEASTLSSIRINTQKVSKNVLNKYATYNYLFTLSGVSTAEVQNCSYMRQAPHDIVARSSGIGFENQNLQLLVKGEKISTYVIIF